MKWLLNELVSEAPFLGFYADGSDEGNLSQLAFHTWARKLLSKSAQLLMRKLFMG